MNTVKANTQVLEKISTLLPELNQENKEINLKVPFYGFSEVFFIIEGLLKATEKLTGDCIDAEQSEIIETTHNLVVLARKLLPYNVMNFMDELLLPSNCLDKELKEIKQK